MFAVIETGGKQYRVAEGDSISVEKLAVAAGGTIVFDKVLLLDDGAKTMVGDPYLKGVTVEAVVEREGKGTKIIVYRYKSKSRERVKRGHRQPFARVKVSKIK